jgi:phosphoribosylaminoimidazolecarboxamide formyltransferase / IMP cyclohydrolase
VSTGGTARALADAGVTVRSVEDFTGFPEIMDGRVKTLHPRLYAGLLAVRSDAEHVGAIAEHGIEEVDLVCVNLYPFEKTAARRDVSEADIIENIDIGGPTMIRAAAKNYAFAVVVTSPESYDAVLDELRTADGLLSTSTRESLAAEAFAYTARYDTAIARWFAEKSEDFPPLHIRAY